MRVKELQDVLGRCPPDFEVKVLGEVEGEDLDICPSVVVMHPSKNYLALLPSYDDVEKGEQVLLDTEDSGSAEGESQGEGQEAQQR